MTVVIPLNWAYILRVISRLFAIIAFLPLITACSPIPDKTIKIGLIAPFSGRYREIGYQAIHGARLALAEYRASDALHKHSVELLAFDDAGYPDSAIEQAKQLLVDTDVVAVIGHWLDATTSAAAPIYVNAGIPILATSGSPEDPEYGGTLFFRLHPKRDLLTAEMEATAKRYNAGSTCHCDVITGAQYLSSALADRADATVVGGPLWSLQEFLHITGINAESSYSITSAPHPLIAKEAAAFLVKYQNAYPDQPAGWVSVHAYEATRLMLIALKNSPDPTAANIAKTLRQTNYSTGMLGDVSFSDTGEWQTPKYHAYTWRNSRLAVP